MIGADHQNVLILESTSHKFVVDGIEKNPSTNPESLHLIQSSSAPSRFEEYCLCTAPRCPCQRPSAERLVGCRKESSNTQERNAAENSIHVRPPPKSIIRK